MRLIDADAVQQEFLEYEFDGKWRGCTIKDLFDSQPTVRPEPHWIPVTERLPENNDPVNVTWVNHNPEVYYMDIKDKPYTATAIYFRGKWFWYSCVIEDWLAEYGSNESFLANLQEAVDRDIEITAWCELPEPYKGVTE